MHFSNSRTLLCCALLATVTSCAATIDHDRTHLRPMVASVRVDPPRKGENRVYFDFRDLTASGVEDAVFDALEDAILARGWELCDDYHSANYVLWADLRLFGEAGTEHGNQMLNGLGAVAAGSVVGYGTARATDNWWLGVGAGAMTGGVTKVALDKLTQVKQWQMVVDLVLGRKVEGGVTTELSTGNEGSAESLTAVGTTPGAESATGAISSSMKQDLEERRVHFELEQRLLATTEGRRMSKTLARNALIPKLVDGLKSQLPRVR